MSRARLAHQQGNSGISNPQRNSLWCVLGVASAVGLLAQLPALASGLAVRAETGQWVWGAFYFWDDSAAQFLPMWHAMGRELLEGRFPLLMPEAWMGGNLPAEALFGLWNPVSLACCVFVALLPDLAMAAVVVKSLFLAILGAGVFALCREYGARASVAAVIGVAVPFSGFVLYFLASTWAAGLQGLAWLPWSWWALRRCVRGGRSVAVAFGSAYLCVSTGEPYALLGLLCVLIGLGVEQSLRGCHTCAGLGRLSAVAAAIGLVVPLIWWPMLASRSVSWRQDLAGWADNRGLLAPDLGDLLSLSMPSFVPEILSFGSFRMSVPSVYFLWFALPLAAWLDWPRLARQWRGYAAPLLVAVVSLLFTLGPSHVWLFRWPLRVAPLLFLAFGVVFARVLSWGLRADHWRLRAGITAAVLMWGGLSAVSAWPETWHYHALAVLLTGALVALVLLWRRDSTTVLIAQLGTVAVLVLQLAWFPTNRDVAAYHFPSSVAELQAQRAQPSGALGGGAGPGTSAQIADREHIPPNQRGSGRAWQEMLLGNMPRVATMDTLTAYTGIGYLPLSRRLCLTHYGGMCPQAHRALWTPDETGTPLADQLKLERVSVQCALLPHPRIPRGWRIAGRGEYVTVQVRNEPVDWPGSRLSIARGTRVLEARQRSSTRESVRFERSSGAQLIFARLAWPGYRATVDGRSVPVESTSAGLVRVALPVGISAGKLELVWQPPGWPVTPGLAAVALLLVAGTEFLGCAYRLRAPGRHGGNL